MRRILFAIPFALFSSVAQADDMYVVEGMEENCEMGLGSEGIIGVGKGWFSLIESQFDRKTPLISDEDGFKRATYKMTAEGEYMGEFVVKIRLTPERIDIRSEPTGDMTGYICP